MRTRLHLTKREADFLTRMAGKVFHTWAGLLSAIVRQWIDDPGRSIPSDAGEVPKDVSAVAKFRESIVSRWGGALERGRKRKRGINETAEAFLKELKRFEKIKLSRSTLYRWAKAYRGRGVVGLIDGRSKPVQRR